MRWIAFLLSLCWITPCWASIQILTGSNNTLSTTLTVYAHPSGSAFASAENSKAMLMSTSGTFKGLRVVLSGVPDNGAGTDSYTFAFMVEGVASAIGCPISETQTSCTDTDAVNVVAGDMVSLQSVPANTPASRNAQWTMQFIPSVHGEYVYGGSSSSALSTAFVQFSPLGSVPGASTSESIRETLMPTGGIVDDLYVELASAPGAGTNYAFTIRKCDPTCADELLACTIADAETTCNNSTAVSFLPGHRLTLESDPTGSVVASIVNWGVIIRPSNPDTFPLFLSSGDSTSGTATEYGPVHGALSYDITEGDVQAIFFPLVFRKMFVRLNLSPGAGTSYFYNLRISGRNGGLSCLIPDTGTDCNGSADELVTAYDEAALRILPANTPAARTTTVGYLVSPAGATLEGATLQGATVQ